ncbi:MAG: helix-turn-helix transcriptional regulator, partial [Candidatus Eremiobacteraeota bacterium]|nr:helix-turn-helix transcriptional regulator [Candidatus Eremiobacteraeota bacterium]
MTSSVASPLSRMRRARGLSQGDVARAAGITRQAVGAIEAGRVQPGVGVALALARVLRSSVEELFGTTVASLDAELSGPHAASRRVATAIVGGRVVARPLDARESALVEPAGALVASAARTRARIEPLADRHALEETVFASGCEPALGLLAGHLNARGGHAVWFASSNRDALYDLADHRVHAAALHGTENDVARLVRR